MKVQSSLPPDQYLPIDQDFRVAIRVGQRRLCESTAPTIGKLLYRSTYIAGRTAAFSWFSGSIMIPSDRPNAQQSQVGCSLDHNSIFSTSDILFVRFFFSF